MRRTRRQSGFTLIEMLVVVGIMAIMMALVVPNTGGLIQSHRMSSAQNLVRSALAQAQAYAAAHQKYAGIRFQRDRKGTQYLVLIEKMDKIDPDDYVAVPNAKPVPLPTGIFALSGVVDIYDGGSGSSNPNQLMASRNVYLQDYDERAGNGRACLENATTFGLVFSPSGQLVVKSVEVVPRGNTDRIFGTYNATGYPVSNLNRRLLSHDNRPTSAPWCLDELSTSGFYLCDLGLLEGMAEDQRYSSLIQEYTGRVWIKKYKSNEGIERIMINFYTGRIMEDVDEMVSGP